MSQYCQDPFKGLILLGKHERIIAQMQNIMQNIAERQTLWIWYNQRVALNYFMNRIYIEPTLILSRVAKSGD
jgi:hypothetical protein